MPSIWMLNFSLIGCQIWPLGSHIGKQTYGHCLLTVIARITKFWWLVHLAWLHYILYDFLVWPTFQGHRVKNIRRLLYIFLLFVVQCSNLAWWCIWVPSICMFSLARSGTKYGCQVAILEIVLCFFEGLLFQWIAGSLPHPSFLIAPFPSAYHR